MTTGFTPVVAFPRQRLSQPLPSQAAEKLENAYATVEERRFSA